MISLEYTFAPCFNSVLPKRAFVLTSIPLTVFVSPVILLSANIDVVVISDGLTSFISFSQDCILLESNALLHVIFIFEFLVLISCFNKTFAETIILVPLLISSVWYLVCFPMNGIFITLFPFSLFSTVYSPNFNSESYSNFTSFITTFSTSLGNSNVTTGFS